VKNFCTTAQNFGNSVRLPGQTQPVFNTNAEALNSQIADRLVLFHSFSNLHSRTHASRIARE